MNSRMACSLLQVCLEAIEMHYMVQLHLHHTKQLPYCHAEMRVLFDHYVKTRVNFPVDPGKVQTRESSQKASRLDNKENVSQI